MLGRDAVHLCALLIFLRRQAKKIANLIECKSQIPATANESQAAQMIVAIGAVVSCRSRRHRQQPDLLVITNRHNLGSGSLSQSTNANAPFSNHRLTL